MIGLHFSEHIQSAVLFTPAFAFLQERLVGRNAFLFTDEGVLSHYRAQTDELGLPCFAMPAGEAHKTQETLFSLLGAMSAASLGRDGVLVALGGGVVGDVGGLAAALYMRGIELWQIPTTLLAQTDASVGGKTAIDFCGVKNLIGVVKQPQYTVVDTAFLHTLPPREIVCGLGEMVKHAGLDGTLFDAMRACDLRDLAALSRLIPANLRLKAEIVQRDPHDKGVRRTLNLGHTTAHAAELSVAGLSHGEAVLVGLWYESKLAERHMPCDGEYLEAFRALVLRALGRDLGSVDFSSGLPLSLRDKKNADGLVTLVVPVRRGETAELRLPYAEYAREIVAIGEELR